MCFNMVYISVVPFLCGVEVHGWGERELGVPTSSNFKDVDAPDGEKS